MVGIATAAAVVASQALISGAFSLTRQAVQLGYIPRVTVVHTSSTQIGQIYIPEVNWALWLGCVALVVGFQHSSNLAAAYGMAVTGTMLTTTLLFHTIACDRWGWPRWRARALTAAVPARGRGLLQRQHHQDRGGRLVPDRGRPRRVPADDDLEPGPGPAPGDRAGEHAGMDLFLTDVARRQPPRVPGTAVFLTSDIGGAPPVLLHHLKHNKVLHEKVMLMSVVTEEIPAADEEDRVECQELGEGFYKVIAHYGFMESPDIPAALALLGKQGADGRPVAIKAMETSFYLGRETLIVTRNTPPHRAGAGRHRPDVDVAEAALHPHDEERALGHRVLRSPAQSRGRARRADPVLAVPRRLR